MAGIRLEGNTSGNVAEVDADNNLKVTLPAVRDQAGYAVSLCEIDDGTATGTPLLRSPRVSRNQRLAAGLLTPLFYDSFNATAMNTSNYRYVAGGALAASQSGGSILFNSASTATTSLGCQLTSWRHFAQKANSGLRFGCTMARTSDPLANQVFEFGLFPHGAGNVAPTEGVFFRMTSAGLVGVINYNTAEVVTSAFTAAFTDSKMFEFEIVLATHAVEFYRDDILLGSIDVPDANGFPNMWNALPISFQFRNPGTVSGAPQMQCKVANVFVQELDLNTVKPWAEQQALAGLMAYQGQNGGTLGTTALYTNSLAAGAGIAMTNTTAALGSGLGGQFAALPTLTAGTDGIVSSYQVPVGSINQTPRSLVITGVRVQSAVSTVLVGGPLLWAYSLAFGHTAVSLATAESGSFGTGTTKAARRIALGYETIAATAAVGTIGAGVYMPFASPIVVNPGEFVQLVAKNLGVVTSSGVVVFSVTFDAHWE